MFLGTGIVALMAAVAGGKTVDMTWVYQSPGSSSSTPNAQRKTAAARDSLNFTWTGTHDVYLMPSCSGNENAYHGGAFTCPSNNAEFGTKLGDTSPLLYTMPAHVTSTNPPTYMCFACKKAGHCDAGMFAILKVSGAASCQWSDITMGTGVTVSGTGCSTNSEVSHNSDCYFSKSTGTCGALKCKNGTFDPIITCGGDVTAASAGVSTTGPSSGGSGVVSAGVIAKPAAIFAAITIICFLHF